MNIRANVMDQVNELRASDLYEVVKVGYKWKFKTPHGVETFKTKRAASKFAVEWKEVYTLRGAQ